MERKIGISTEIKSAALVFDYPNVEFQAAALIDNYARNHETLNLPNEAYNNAQTALFEELTAAGDLSVIEFEGDQQQIHDATMQRLLNGWSNSLPFWEQKRRFREVCEELMVYGLWQRVAVGELPVGTKLATISDYPLDAPTEQEAHLHGYRSLNQKGMVRLFDFYQRKDGSWVRLLEQVSRSNSCDGSSELWLSRQGIDSNSSTYSVLSNQAIIPPERFSDGVVSFMKELDQQNNQEVIYGELLEQARSQGRPDYSELRRVSLKRRRQLEDITAELSYLEISLQIKYAKGEISYDQKKAIYYKRQSELTDQTCLLSPEYAFDARGAAAVPFYLEASLALAANNQALFKQKFSSAKAYEDKQAASVCGGRNSELKELEDFEKYTDKIYQEARDKKKNWKYKRGVCIVKTCPTRPEKTKVGPCSVCSRCQALFDLNIDPTKLPEANNNPKKTISKSTQKSSLNKHFNDSTSEKENDTKKNIGKIMIKVAT